MSKKQTVYLLRVRQDDEAEWSRPETYESKRERDEAAAMARVFGGFRTHSYEEPRS